MRKLKMPDAVHRDPHAIDPVMPLFVIEETKRSWQVRITWPDGGEGPSLGFISRADAEIWISRDARDWFVRLNALAHSSQGEIGS